MKALKQVWFCGGGTQSCGMATLIIDGKLPKPDLSLIADTGREKSSTWKYLDEVLTPNLAKIGVVIERVKASEFGYCAPELWSKTEELLIPAYSSITAGSVGKLKGFCNRWWKLDALRIYLRRVHGLTRSKYRNWVGYSFDEQRRWVPMMDGEEYQKGLMWFPLVDLGLRRRQSIQLVLDHGWPEPPPSACWMCPNQSDDEWRHQKENAPAEFAQAVEMDASIRDRDPHAWLHKSCKPLGDVDFTEEPDLFSRACDSGSCFT